MVSHFFNFIGYDLRKFNLSHIEGFFGFDMFHDLETLFRNKSIKVIDVGASDGEWLLNLKKYIKDIDTYIAFEPDPRMNINLIEYGNNSKSIRDFLVFDYAVGAKNGQMNFKFMSSSSMNSFLNIGNQGWGSILNEKIFEVKTLDNVLNEIYGVNVDFDILKIDVQGYDFEVIKGCASLLKNNSIKIIVCEVNFQNLYESKFDFGELLNSMESNNYVLFGTYYPHVRNFSLAWFDAVFISKTYIDFLEVTMPKLVMK
jgi:FkbM family methyltransferase